MMLSWGGGGVGGGKLTLVLPPPPLAQLIWILLKDISDVSPSPKKVFLAGQNMRRGVPQAPPEVSKEKPTSLPRKGLCSLPYHAVPLCLRATEEQRPAFVSSWSTPEEGVAYPWGHTWQQPQLELFT
uniref:Uncharacterized protein n=1 Tax=Sphaerodactylus townsendi TaxID=933632 RepID=A0ACB8EXK0_9SAUR